MPLLDESGAYGQRVGVARDALDPYSLHGATPPASPTDKLSKLLDDLKNQNAATPPIDFSKLLGDVGRSSQSALGGLLTNRTPNGGLNGQAPVSEPLRGSVGQSPIIGTRNYLTGKGAPDLRISAQNTARMFGWDQRQFSAWDAIINAESGWNPRAQNPTSTAFGLGQFLNSTWKGYGPKTSDPTQQLAYMARYIRDRYGTPERALAFHQAHNFY